MVEAVLLVITGIAAGVIGGMGMGGGTVLIPLLTIFFDIGQHSAQAVNLTAFIPMSLAAIFIHAKNKLIDYKAALTIILPAAITAAGGALLARSVEGPLLKKLFGVFLVALAVLQTVMIFKKQ